MPIKIPDSLPARHILEGENVFVIGESRAMHQDIRPLRILILNLMPLKIATETHLLRTRITSYNVCYTKLLRLNISDASILPVCIK